MHSGRQGGVMPLIKDNLNPTPVLPGNTYTEMFDALHDEVEGADIDSWCEKITDTITLSAMKVAGKTTHQSRKTF